MKAASLYAYDPAMNVELTIENVAPPAVTAPSEAIVKVGAADMCRTDLQFGQAGWEFHWAGACSGGSEEGLSLR